MNLSTDLEELLSSEAFTLCRRISDFGYEEGVSAWLTGGGVRDLVLGRSSKDLDVSVSSMGTEFSEKFSAKFQVTVTATFHRYGCSALRLKDGSKCDIVPLRKENYPAPAAPPEIAFISSIKDDLFRRDFTLNAMAISLCRSDFGELYDFYGGYEDLQKRTLRIIHDQSFMDDPVRIFRGIRFAARMGLTIAEETKDVLYESYARGAIGFLKNEVFLREFESTFSTGNVSSLLIEIDRWSLLSHVKWPGFTSAIPDKVSLKISRISRIISFLLKTRKTVRQRKCSWLSVLAVMVLVPLKAYDYFVRRFTPPPHLLAYLDEVKGLSIELKQGLQSGEIALTKCLKRPRKAEVLVGSLAVVANSKDDVERCLKAIG